MDTIDSYDRKLDRWVVSIRSWFGPEFGSSSVPVQVCTPGSHHGSYLGFRSGSHLVLLRGCIDGIF